MAGEGDRSIPNVASVVPGMSVTNLKLHSQLNFKPQHRYDYELIYVYMYIQV